MVLVYVEFLIDNGLGGGVHGPQGSGSGPGERISHLLLQSPERREVRMMNLDMIFEGWTTEHWRGSDYGKGLGWEDSPRLSLFCLPWAILA